MLNLLHKNYIKTDNKNKTKELFFTILSVVRFRPDGEAKPWSDSLWCVYNAFDGETWVMNIITLFIITQFMGYVFNRFMRNFGGWIKPLTRVYILILDLAINLVIAVLIYRYLDAECSLAFYSYKCPILFSPFIMVTEFIVVYKYYKYGKSQAAAKESLNKRT